MRRVVLVVPAAVAVLLALVAGAGANTSHDGWPKIDGVLLMNKTDSSRPLDARPGHDPFGGRDRRYSCDAIHKRGKCHRRFVRLRGTHARVMTSRHGHNELLGGHGSDAIHAGPWGDVIWGDYKPSGQPNRPARPDLGRPGARPHLRQPRPQRDPRRRRQRLDQGPLRRRLVNCGAGNDLLYISRRAQKHYKIRNCERISHKTLGR